jgi:hypothetical protein
MRDSAPSQADKDAGLRDTTISSAEDAVGSVTFTPPSINLPKGGGALRGIGEKFAANPVTGTGSMSVPIATSPGRSGFGPELSLSYDSGAGNGAFGFGWSLSIPAITRKTDKGLPQYLDAIESDVFILSGAEDLVPILSDDGRRWSQTRTIDETTYQIHRCRPRIEGLFARIERRTSSSTGEIHWRSITRDNVTTVYGKDNNSRIFDPADPEPVHPARIFSWLICQSYDDKGNAIVYKYAEEDDRNVHRSQANERNRVRTANRYLKCFKYGICTLNRHTATWQVIDPAELADEAWMFEVVFDYEKGHYEEIPLDPALSYMAQHRFVQASAPVGRPWSVRPDAFSSYRAGFEVRTSRLCQRMLVFHHIPDLPTGEKGYDGLVRSTEFTYLYEPDPKHAKSLVYSRLVSVTQSGYKRQDDGSYLRKSLPPLEFEYSDPVLNDIVEEVRAESLENLPAGLDGATFRQKRGQSYKGRVVNISESCDPENEVQLITNVQTAAEVTDDGQPLARALDEMVARQMKVDKVSSDGGYNGPVSEEACHKHSVQLQPTTIRGGQGAANRFGWEAYTWILNEERLPVQVSCPGGQTVPVKPAQKGAGTWLVLRRGLRHLSLLPEQIPSQATQTQLAHLERHSPFDSGSYSAAGEVGRQCCYPRQCRSDHSCLQASLCRWQAARAWPYSSPYDGLRFGFDGQSASVACSLASSTTGGSRRRLYFYLIEPR